MILGEKKEAPFLRVSHCFCLLFNLEAHLISSEASHMFVKIKQTLSENVPKGDPQEVCYVDKEQFKIK